MTSFNSEVTPSLFGQQLEALKNWIASGVGAVLRSISDKLRENVSAADYGAVGDGITPDEGAILAAATALGAAGGVVRIPNGLRCLIDTNLTIPPNVHLRGPHWFVGSPKDNTSAPYGSLGGALLINPAATITLQGGASSSGLLVYRKGMTFPASDSSAFLGTAFTFGGDDVSVTHSMILGFNKAVYSSGHARPRLLDLRLDNNNGIEITQAFDIPVIERVHAWPFATIASYAITPTSTKLQRSGKAFYLHDVADWAQVSSCFAFGYNRGYDLFSVQNVTLVGCKVDGTWGTAGSDVIAGSRGFSISGDSAGNHIIGGFSASQELLYYLGTLDGRQNYLVSPGGKNGTIHGLLFDAGDWSVIGGGVDTVQSGITYNNAACSVSVDQFRFGASITIPINVTVAATSDKLRLSNTSYPSVAAGSSPIGGIGTFVTPTVVSASPLVLPTTGNYFNISGTTGFSAIQKGWAGREITLFFSGILTVTHGTGSVDAARLAGAANLTTAAGTTLTLRHNGTQWYETGRAA